MKDTSKCALPFDLTKLGTFSPRTLTMISRFPAPALLASTANINQGSLTWSLCTGDILMIDGKALPPHLLKQCF